MPSRSKAMTNHCGQRAARAHPVLETQSARRRNVGPQINGNVRPKGFANTTFDDQAARSSPVGSGKSDRHERPPRRTGLSGDFNGDSDVDATDYALKGSSSKNDVPAGRRSGISAATLTLTARPPSAAVRVEQCRLLAVAFSRNLWTRKQAIRQCGPEHLAQKPANRSSM
jgi:hypothetical protein